MKVRKPLITGASVKELAKKLPETCFSVLPATGEVIQIRFGVAAYLAGMFRLQIQTIIWKGSPCPKHLTSNKFCDSMEEQ